MVRYFQKNKDGEAVQWSDRCVYVKITEDGSEYFSKDGHSTRCLYSVDTATRYAADGLWKEIPDPTRPRFFRYKNSVGTNNPFWMVKPDGKVISYPGRNTGHVMSWGIQELLVPMCEEFSANSLEEALDIQFPRTRYFRSYVWLWIIAPDKTVTYMRHRDDSPHKAFLLERHFDTASDVKEVFAKSLPEALDIVFPIPTPVVVKPVPTTPPTYRYFHPTDEQFNDIVVWIYDPTTKNVTKLMTDEREVCSLFTLSRLVAGDGIVEFNAKSRESAIRSRLYALKYIEGKEASKAEAQKLDAAERVMVRDEGYRDGYNKGYQTAKRELLSKLQAA